MGIPSYFNYIIEHHKVIFKKLNEFKEVHNLYLDSNSIIYDAMRNMDIINIGNSNQYEKSLINQVCIKITEYIDRINPNNVLIAFDGVAPVAKLEQQRQRRYKSMFIKKVENEIKQSSKERQETNKYNSSNSNKNEKKNGIEKQFTWDQTAITPGTNFMKKLDNYVKNFFKDPKKFNCKNIIVSGSNRYGEGEHKIFEYIRNHKVKHKDEITFIYGLDADLIMLSLNHLCTSVNNISDNIFLFRENPGYDKNLNAIFEKDELCVMDIHKLSSVIYKSLLTKEYNYEKTNNKKQREKGKKYSNKINNIIYQNKIADYILISFLLGNDFMPHIPSLNIRTNGISIIFNTYKNIFGVNETIYNEGEINWKNLKKLINELASNEYNNLINEYKLIRKQRRKVVNEHSTIEEKIQHFNMLPSENREIEELIDPYQKGWEYRYYKCLFDININNEYRKQICNNYLEGLEWTMKYYTTGCVNYRWFYRYHYPPLLTDLIRCIPDFNTSFISNDDRVVSNYTQLSYVLPGECLNLLPKKIERALLKENKEYYSKQYPFIWAFCKYFWESHIKLPHIDIEQIEELVQSCE